MAPQYCLHFTLQGNVWYICIGFFSKKRERSGKELKIYLLPTSYCFPGYLLVCSLHNCFFKGKRQREKTGCHWTYSLPWPWGEHCCWYHMRLMVKMFSPAQLLQIWKTFFFCVYTHSKPRAALSSATGGKGLFRSIYNCLLLQWLLTQPYRDCWICHSAPGHVCQPHLKDYLCIWPLILIRTIQH